MNEVQSTFDSDSAQRPLKDSVRDFERQVIVEALKRNQDDKRKVARMLGISLSSLYRKISESPNGDDFEGMGLN